jgi:flotillin
MSVALIAAAAAVVLLILIVIAFTVLWKVPAADQALIVTGMGSRGAEPQGKSFKIVTGGGSLVVPALQKAQYLSLKADKAILDVEGVDSQKIPVGVRGVAIFKVGDDQTSITNAATRFLHDQGAGTPGGTSQMHDLVREVFHGHLRSIIGGLTVEDLIANRNELAQHTREASMDEMQKLGLVVDSLQIQEIIDPTGYIRALGEPRAAEVQKQARIAQAQADREATEREQQAAALKAAAERDTAIKRAEFQAEMDKAAAVSAQSGPLADAEARKNVVVQETDVAELEAQREERRLDTTVRKPADAAAYQARVEAEGKREARIALAEADKREVELRAEADARRTELAAAADAKRVELAAAAEAKKVRSVGEAEAAATSAKGDAEGSAVRARGLAEAEAIAKRAEALEAESEAVINQMLAERMPEIVRAASESFQNVDNLTVLNGAQGMGEIVAQVIGQAGPAMKLAREALGTQDGDGRAAKPAGGNGAPPSNGAAG